MDIFYFNVNEEKNPESEEIWTPYININNELQLHNGYIFIFYLKIWQLVYCTTFKDMIYQRCYIWIGCYQS